MLERTDPNRTRHILTAAAALLLVTGLTAPAWSGVEPMSDRELARQTELILGLDGAAYQPYKTSVITWIQQELRQRHLYDGPASGSLDEATMQAIAAFQRSHGLHASGIPSPLTRAAIRRPPVVDTAKAAPGSPTIPAS